MESQLSGISLCLIIIAVVLFGVLAMIGKVGDEIVVAIRERNKDEKRKDR